MKFKEIINKAKKEIKKYKKHTILTDLARSLVCVLCEEFNCNTWSDVCNFIEENTTFKFSWNKTVSENINDFVKSYNTQLEVE